PCRRRHGAAPRALLHRRLRTVGDVRLSVAAATDRRWLRHQHRAGFQRDVRVEHPEAFDIAGTVTDTGRTWRLVSRHALARFQYRQRGLRALRRARWS